MNTAAARLSEADRAELCRRVDLPALLAGAGVEVSRAGNAWRCKLRPEERTPSCQLYPPGTGKRGAAGWTLHDYGDGWGGDALGYLTDKRGLPFVEAVAELCHLAGWTPPTWKTTRQDAREGAYRRPSLTTAPPQPAPAATAPQLPHDAQLDACMAFALALMKLAPDCIREGTAYLESRGCRPPGFWPGALLLPGEACPDLAAMLAKGPEADLLARAGLLKPAAAGKPPRLPWWDRVCLLGCYDPFGCLAYFVGRRLDWKDGDRWGKYINQPCNGGAVRVPYGLPVLYEAAGRPPERWPWKPAKDKARDVLLVEGPLDALGAACLGWPAVALLTRLQAHDHADRHGAAALALEAHLPALRDVRRVRVVPDADPGEKGAEGETLAARLVAWLTHAGVKADLATLADLYPDARDCKDLADVAAGANRERIPA